MIATWIFFYVCISRLISEYTLGNMERSVESGITQINTSFLQMERLGFAMLRDEKINELLTINDNLKFHNAASEAEERIEELIREKSFLSGIIIYSDNKNFYRARGKISNTDVERLLRLAENDDDYIVAKLDNENYIGYIKRAEKGGGVAMLMKETEISRLFGRTQQSGINFVLTADDVIAASDGTFRDGAPISEFLSVSDNTRSEQVGSTPFRLWASYTDKGGRIHVLFMAAMVIMAVLLFFLLQIFLNLWQKNFVDPIQTVIDEVESFDGVKGKLLPLTGQEQFDGLIRGINEMAERIESKDKALVISLKKQINAHFTFNVLNIIKAFSEKGESQKAGELCEGLSLLLRYANGGENFISGMEEFYILEKYVEIMQIRYPNRFTSDIDFDDFLDDVRLPRMLLQPIVENGIVHGIIGGQKQNGEIKVRAETRGNVVLYFIEDNGCGMSEQRLSELRQDLIDAPFTEPEDGGLSNIALVNIERRIKFYFGKDFGLTVNSEKGKGTQVTVKLPKRK